MCSSDLLYTVLGLSTVSMVFLAVMNTLGFGPFSQFYELLHTFLGYVDSFDGISGSHENSWIWSILAVYELLHTVLGSIDGFEGISGIYQNSSIWSFFAVI